MPAVSYSAIYVKAGVVSHMVVPKRIAMVALFAECMTVTDPALGGAVPPNGSENARVEMKPGFTCVAAHMIPDDAVGEWLLTLAKTPGVPPPLVPEPNGGYLRGARGMP
jgi:hypothetical protein